MNEDNLHSWIEPDLEARIVALVVGEASDFEREELERLIHEKPELALFRDRMAATHVLLGRVATGETEVEGDWKLSPERRQIVLETLEGAAESAGEDPDQEEVEEIVPYRKPRVLRWVVSATGACAALALFGLVLFYGATTEYKASSSYGVDTFVREAPTTGGATSSEPPVSYMNAQTASNSSIRDKRTARSSEVAVSEALEEIENSVGYDSDYDFKKEGRSGGNDSYAMIGHGGRSIDAMDGEIEVTNDSVALGAGGDILVSTASGSITMKEGDKSKTKKELGIQQHGGVTDIQIAEELTKRKPASGNAQTDSFSLSNNDVIQIEAGSRMKSDNLGIERDVPLEMPSISASGQSEGGEIRVGGALQGRDRSEKDSKTLFTRNFRGGANTMRGFGYRELKENVEAPEEAGKKVSADPFAAPRSASQDIPQQQDILHGGVSLSVDFGDSAETAETKYAPPAPTTGMPFDSAPRAEATKQAQTNSPRFPASPATTNLSIAPAPVGDPAESVAKVADVLATVVPRIVGGGSASSREGADMNSVAVPALEDELEMLRPAPTRKTIAAKPEALAKRPTVISSPKLAEPRVNGNQFADREERSDTEVSPVFAASERQLGRRYRYTTDSKAPGAAQLGHGGYYGEGEPRELDAIQLRTGQALDGLKRLSDLSLLQKPGQSGQDTSGLDAEYRFLKSKALSLEQLQSENSDTPANESKVQWGDNSAVFSSLDVADEDFLSRKNFGFETKAQKRGSIRRAAPQGLEEKLASAEPFSTFSLHVSDVSFKLALASLSKGEWPDADRVRIEEFVNAFDYGDPMPTTEEKVACHMEQAIHPFLQQRNLLRVSMRTAAVGRNASTPLRLTLLLDNSGSMERIDRQETVRRAFAMLASQLQPNDQVTLISFARQPRLLADRVSGDQATKLVEIIRELPSEGGTNLEAALKLAFEKAQEQKQDNAQNRVILLTDGAANLGDAEPESLAQNIETMRDAGIAFDAAGIGTEGLNDEILEALTRKGDGRYYLLDQPNDADAGFARQIAGALRPAAGNVKVQIEFNPDRVENYKLLGFEKHRLKKEDFRDDKVDAAEMASEEAGVAVYQFQPRADGSGDIGFASVRFRDMATGEMVEKRWVIPYRPDAPRPDLAAPSLRVATAASQLAAKLKGETLGDVVELDELSRLVSELPSSWMAKKRVTELHTMIDRARELEGQ